MPRGSGPGTEVGRGGADPAHGGRQVPDRVVLVGFMGAGKSTVGPLLARLLGYRFVDLDREVERSAGRSIRAIFADSGEAAFREMERRVTERLDRAERVVVAAGGGWMARPELRDRWPDAVRVWLRASPAAVLERIGDGVPSRPLLDPRDPERSVQEILRGREPDYARAELRVETDGRSPAEVAAEIHRLLTRGAGEPSTG